MAKPEPVVIPESEAERLVSIRQTVDRARRCIALHEDPTKAGRQDGQQRPTHGGG